MLRTVTLALLALVLSTSAASAQEPTPLPAAPGSEAEPNDTPETATPISDGGRIRATRASNDVDLYSFTAEAGDRVFATVMTAASVSGDSRLALLGPDGTELESDNDNGSFQANSSSIAGTTVAAGGTYRLRVDAPGGTTRLAPYDVVLDVQSGAPAAEVEPNNGQETVQLLRDTRLVSGTKGANDFDLHGLELGSRTATTASSIPARPTSGSAARLRPAAADPSPPSRPAARAKAASRPTSTAHTRRTARRTSCRRRSRSRAAPGRSTPPGRCGTSSRARAMTTSRSPSRRTAAPIRDPCSSRQVAT
jgi:Bacterial pre-peptidase C-terminal domain